MAQKIVGAAHPGMSKASLKRVISEGTIVAFAIGLCTMLFATHFYVLSVALCAALPLLAIALDAAAEPVLDDWAQANPGGKEVLGNFRALVAEVQAGK
jgi:hypothetical protein